MDPGPDGTQCHPKRVPWSVLPERRARADRARKQAKCEQQRVMRLVDRKILKNGQRRQRDRKRRLAKQQALISARALISFVDSGPEERSNPTRQSIADQTSPPPAPARQDPEVIHDQDEEQETLSPSN